jgi:acyl-CoA thioesterase
MTTAPLITPGAFLRQPTDGPIRPGSHLWGFGGLNGGLALGLLIAAMQEHVPDAQLHSATGHFLRPINAEVKIETSVLRSGRVSMLSARAISAEGIHVDAAAIFGTAGPIPSSAALSPVAPAAPPAPRPQDCEIFTVPPEFVAVTGFLEIRPVGPNRPYAGGTEPELTAWIRLLEDEVPPDAHRLAFLMDALAPSYSAVLSRLSPIPTVELTVRPSGNPEPATSPWILLRATTRSVGADGWIDEQIDVWDLGGVHRGSAQQLRLLRGR